MPVANPAATRERTLYGCDQSSGLTSDGTNFYVTCVDQDVVLRAQPSSWAANRARRPARWLGGGARVAGAGPCPLSRPPAPRLLQPAPTERPPRPRPPSPLPPPTRGPQCSR